MKTVAQVNSIERKSTGRPMEKRAILVFFVCLQTLLLFYMMVVNKPCLSESLLMQECKCDHRYLLKDLVKNNSRDKGFSVNNVENNKHFPGDNFDNDKNRTKQVLLSAMQRARDPKFVHGATRSRLTDYSVITTQPVHNDKSVTAHILQNDNSAIITQSVHNNNSVITTQPAHNKNSAITTQPTHSDNSVTAIQSLHKDNSVMTQTVYNESALLHRIKKIHDSMYTPPTNESCRRRLPQCVIIGMKKCGTQELIDFLSMHPNIVRRGKPVYEINCFLSDEKLRKCKRWMPCSYSDQITMTKSSIYFTTPSVPERLYKYNKELKMILLVREPVERLISDYSFEFFQRVSKHGKIVFENSSSVYANMLPLDQGLVNRFSRKVKKTVPEVIRSTYDIPMARYLKFFRKDQILVIESKELKTDPVNVLRKVESFLGLEHKIKKESFLLNKEKGFYCVKSDPGMVCYGDNRGRNTTKKMAIRSDTRAILRDYFRKHNEGFYNLIGKKFDW